MKKLGFKGVITYINSGNVIFSSSYKEDRIQIICENKIKSRCNFDVPVRIISVTDLASALDNVPVWWDKDSKSKHNAIFIISPMTAKEIIEQIGMSEYEKISSYDNIIFWSAPIKTFSKTKLGKISKLPAYHNITIRNSNTTKKLVEIAQRI